MHIETIGGSETYREDRAPHPALVSIRRIMCMVTHGIRAEVAHAPLWAGLGCCTINCGPKMFARLNGNKKTD